MNVLEILATQLPALLGVLVGTVGTMLATGLNERTRWRRTQTVRWDERRLDAYVELTKAVKEIHAVATRMLGEHRPNARRPAMDRNEGLARLAEADVRHTLAWEAVLLLGDEITVRAAAEWRHAVRDIESAARALPLPPTDVSGMIHRADVGRDGFYRAARQSLGVRGGSVEQVRRLLPKSGRATPAVLLHRQSSALDASDDRLSG
ncbi:hypothetical protein O7607_25025 [Micromonospora sp. WMMA1949]|uniref:hypothetical protein n=1 Tax=Micromonospora sp. WMMA1949 TaxID=3015162 RepID=UPI0022B63CFC|nr:hypothetical protein [Micromonospora sp. WMMA1949]MCZ7429018.1 hypothetical protein [Micromonospora sp. WMMA1949]